jgi:RNA polymerase sigma factor (sigma-70 family)
MMRKSGGASLRVLGGLFDLGVASAASDGQLLEQFAKGSAVAAEAAFAALLARHGPMVLRVCKGVLRDEDSAMDAFQATFLILVSKSRSLWVRESLGPWLHRVACRAAERLRYESTRRRRIELRAAELASMQTKPVGPQHDELFLVLHQEVDRLPESFRVAILLCDLEGRTCEEAARILACPVGTVASRLARGRGRLRDQLTRRGFAPVAPALAAALSPEAAGATLQGSLRESTIRLALGYAASRSALGASSHAAVPLAMAVSRSLFMIKMQALAAALICAACGLLATVSAYRVLAAPQSPSAPPVAKQPTPVKKQEKALEQAGAATPNPQEDLFLTPEWVRETQKDSLIGTFANMRPLIQTARGSRFQARCAVLNKDGTVKLFRTDAMAPIVRPMRHKTPIREVAFIEQCKLLITTSDGAVKIWDALSGDLRKEIDGEVMRPLLFTSISSCAEPGPDPVRFVTVDANGRSVTTWDAKTLERVAVFHPDGTARLIGAGVTADGKTLATIAADRSVTLWAMASNRPLATLYDPSPAAACCFAEDVNLPAKPVLRLTSDFWKIVAPLVPTREEPKK